VQPTCGLVSADSERDSRSGVLRLLWAFPGRFVSALRGRGLDDDRTGLEPGSSGRQGDNEVSAEEIVAALSRLSADERMVLVLRDFRGVPVDEVRDLLSLTPAGVEALLARARAGFQAQLSVAVLPIGCAETGGLFERQLAGSITVAERYSLRRHLRECSFCSALARTLRSSTGKVASVLFWPGAFLSRLGSVLTQAPTAVHVATVISSTAAIASVAVPAGLEHAAAVQVEPHAAAKPFIAKAVAVTYRSYPPVSSRVQPRPPATVRPAGDHAFAGHALKAHHSRPEARPHRHALVQPAGVSRVRAQKRIHIWVQADTPRSVTPPAPARQAQLGGRAQPRWHATIGPATHSPSLLRPPSPRPGLRLASSPRRPAQSVAWTKPRDGRHRPLAPQPVARPTSPASRLSPSPQQGPAPSEPRAALSASSPPPRNPSQVPQVSAPGFERP
jgi:hypothetical protein